MTNLRHVLLAPRFSILLAVVSVTFSLVYIVLSEPIVHGEERPATTPNLTPGMMPAAAGAPASGNPDSKPNGKPDGNPTATTDQKKPVDETAASSDLVKRPIMPPEAPNKRELDVRQDQDGMVQFQFRNQAWPDVLKWLAETSQMSLDWQELPGDYINLSTQRPYSIVETRDLFNRHLLARGFTLLEIDGVIQVGKTDKINSALVPKVLPEDLDALPPHRFVRCSFPLDTLLVEEIVEEFKSLLSTNGKLIALHSTNRLEAMDAAGNLQEIKRVLIDEQSEDVRQQLAREFPLQYVRSDEVKVQLEGFLGITKQAAPAVTNPRQMEAMQQQMMQQQQQMMQQQQMQKGGKGEGQGGSPNKRPSEIYLVSNPRQNSIIVHAPPNKMAIVAAFIKRIDVPNEGANSFRQLEQRLKVYRLSSLSPKQLVASLIAMDALEPTTRLEVDEENNAIIAHASLADQYAIQQVIERLDGSARTFDVLQLRRLRAEDVAGTIKFLMGVKDNKDENKSSRRSYSYYDPFGQGSDDKKKKDDSFRVGANIEDNQILLWANEVEREEINKLLIKLGEIPPEGSQGNPFRLIEGSRAAETKEYLEAIKKKWQSISPGSQLILPDASEYDAPYTVPVEQMNEEKSPPKDKPSGTPQPDISSEKKGDQPKPGTASTSAPTASSASTESPSNLAKSTKRPKNSSSEKLVQTQNPSTNPPVEIEFDVDGNLVLKSRDIEALNKLESLMLRDAPPKKPYDVFEVKNTRASWIVLNLEDYFKEDKKKDNDRDSFYRFLFFDESPDKKNEDPQLGKKRAMRFISDNDTNTIVAIGASNAEKQLIKELIELWDTPDTKKAKDARYTKLVSVQYSRADAIEQAIKDAYRDFLSQNDKAFDRGAEQGGKGREEKRDAGSSTRKFSLGVDTLTNTIVVSAEGEDFLKVICDMINELDMAAKPSGVVQVLELNANGPTTKSMEKALKALLESSKKSPNPNANQNNQGQPNQNGGQQNSGEGRGRNSRD